MESISIYQKELRIKIVWLNFAYSYLQKLILNNKRKEMNWKGGIMYYRLSCRTKLEYWLCLKTWGKISFDNAVESSTAKDVPAGPQVIILW